MTGKDVVRKLRKIGFVVDHVTGQPLYLNWTPASAGCRPGLRSAGFATRHFAGDYQTSRGH